MDGWIGKWTGRRCAAFGSSLVECACMSCARPRNRDTSEMGRRHFVPLHAVGLSGFPRRAVPVYTSFGAERTDLVTLKTRRWPRPLLPYARSERTCRLHLTRPRTDVPVDRVKNTYIGKEGGSNGVHYKMHCGQGMNVEGYRRSVLGISHECRGRSRITSPPLRFPYARRVGKQRERRRGGVPPSTCCPVFSGFVSIYFGFRLVSRLVLFRLSLRGSSAGLVTFAYIHP